MSCKRKHPYDMSLATLRNYFYDLQFNDVPNIWFPMDTLGCAPTRWELRFVQGKPQLDSRPR